MKKLFIQIAFITLLFPYASCTKDIMGYEGMEGVYFAVQSGASYGSLNTWPYQPKTSIEFSRIAENEMTVRIKIMATGPTKNYDRTFKVELNPEVTTAVLGTHYIAFPNEVIIPADSLVGYLPITAKRTPDLQATAKVIGLRLVSNEHFGLSFKEWDAIPSLNQGTEPVPPKMDNSVHQVILNDFMVRPTVWVGSVTIDNVETGTLGAFTRRKMELICEVMNLTYADFSSSATMPSVLIGVIANEMSRYLKEKLEAGTPILEEDGRLMYIGGVPWTTIVGVPHK